MTSAQQHGLISQYSATHSEKASWGRPAHKRLFPIPACTARPRPASFVEYDCGKSTLYQTLEYNDTSHTRIVHFDCNERCVIIIRNSLLSGVLSGFEEYKIIDKKHRHY